MVIVVFFLFSLSDLNLNFIIFRSVLNFSFLNLTSPSLTCSPTCPSSPLRLFSHLIHLLFPQYTFYFIMSPCIPSWLSLPSPGPRSPTLCKPSHKCTITFMFLLPYCRSLCSSLFPRFSISSFSLSIFFTLPLFSFSPFVFLHLPTLPSPYLPPDLQSHLHFTYLRT